MAEYLRIIGAVGRHSAEARRRAGLAIASAATDEAECLEFLRMVGLVDPPRRRERGKAGQPSPDEHDPDLWPAL